MAVEFDAAASNVGAISNSISWNHTVGSGENRIILVAVASGSTSPIVDSVAPTVGGNACSLLHFQTRDITSGGTAWRLGVWYYLAPASGELAIAYNRGSEVQYLAGGSMSYSGVDQADPFGDEGGAADGLAGPASFSDDIAAAVGGMVADFVVQNSQAARELIAGANQTERVNAFGSETQVRPWLKASDEAGAATVTMSWANADSAVNYTHYAVALNAAEDAGVTISSVSDSTLTHGQTGVVLTGAGFSASGNTVIVSPTDDVEDVLAVAQTITAEGTTEITFTADLDSFDFGTLYLFVVNGDSESNETGEVISRVVGSVTLNFTDDNIFIDENGDAVTATDLTFHVWRASRPNGNPDQIITEVDITDGELALSIDVGSLEDEDPVSWFVFDPDDENAQLFSAGVTNVTAG